MPCRERTDCPEVPVESAGAPIVGTLLECGPLAQGPPDLRACRYALDGGDWP